MGELAQLSGRPSLVDGVALTDGEAIVIPPDRLRALLVAEAELGERIMRALILRRVGLIETRRRAGRRRRRRRWRRAPPGQFPAPQRPSLPAPRPGARTPAARRLLDRFQVAAGGIADRALSRRAVAAQPERGPARPLHRPGRADRRRQAVRRGDRRRRPGGPCDCGLCRLGGPFGPGVRLPLVRRPGRRVGRASRTTSAFRPASRAWR